jgi:hypothetical protein
MRRLLLGLHFGEREVSVGQTRTLEERLRFLLLQLEIARQNGLEFQQQRIERLVRSVEAELGGGAEK